MLNRLLPLQSRSTSRHSRQGSLNSGSFDGDRTPSTPQMDDDDNSQFADGHFSGPRRVTSGWSQKLSPRALLATPPVNSRSIGSEAEGIPREMIPALTLLAAHGSRVYIEGYFMLLAELNAEGQPVPNPHWVEVFGVLQGTVLTMWDAALLEEGRHDTSFINVGDGYMRSVETLGDNLQNIIVLSTTMKNRYLLQFGTKKLFNEWTAALRLSAFERTSLQEAYTGALLSAKGSQLHGVKALLSETKFKKESWCQVRFGVGMPWRRVWAVVTPNGEIEHKKERKRRGALGKVELFNDPRDAKKKKASPVATVERAVAAFAVFPEKSVLVNVSSLLKMEGFVIFQNETEARETAVFLMPDPHPGIEGYETLIRFLIPVLDVFGLYGRPHRLNADKNDINSLLFGLPTLPRAHYLDVIDVYMLASLGESPEWSASEWNTRIKELIARKMAMGFKGTGSISRSRSGTLSGSDSSSLRNSPALQQRKPRAISDPHGAKLFATPSPNDTATTAASSTSSLNNKHAPPVPSPLVHSRPAPKAPPFQQTSPPEPEPAMPPAPVQVYPQPAGYASETSMAATLRAPEQPERSVPFIVTDTAAPKGPRPGPGPEPSQSKHTRTKSEGGDRIPGILTPQLGDDSAGASPPRNTQRDSRPTLASAESFASASEGSEQLDFGLSDSPNLFDPAYRPAHQSYADYSEYMKQYLNRTLGNGEATTTPNVKEDDMALSEPTTPRATNGGAKLLDTPIRSPQLSVGGTPTAAEEAAPQLGPSPPSEALGSLALPRPAPGVGAQRRPSGPRPDPTQLLRVDGRAASVRKPVPSDVGADSPPAPTNNDIPQQFGPSSQKGPVPNPYAQNDLSFTPSGAPLAYSSPSNGYLGGFGVEGAPFPRSSSPHSQPQGAMPYGPMPTGPRANGPPGRPLNEMYAGSGGMPMPNGPNFAPPGRRGSPGPQQGQLPPQMRMRIPAPGSYGAPPPQPGFGGPFAAGRGDGPPSVYSQSPPAGYGAPVHNPYAPPRNGGMPGGADVPYQQRPGNAKTGPPMALNEVRAQMLRDTRAQAKNNGGYPSFH